MDMPFSLVGHLPFDLKMKILRDHYGNVKLVEDKTSGKISAEYELEHESYITMAYVYFDDAVNRMLMRLYVKLLVEMNID